MYNFATYSDTYVGLLGAGSPKKPTDPGSPKPQALNPMPIYTSHSLRLAGQVSSSDCADCTVMAHLHRSYFTACRA